ncbi:MAG: hypothetical protein KGI84_06205, partial [Elusimicrobia bacterium]|nr:hypothetical protein [Elusimicrobiota bacterium]
VSGLSTPSQPDSSAKAASKKTKRLTMVAHAAPEKSPGSSAQYGPAGLNRSVPAAFQTAKQLAGGLGQQ